jgi:hypothetical protein
VKYCVFSVLHHHHQLYHRYWKKADQKLKQITFCHNHHLYHFDSPEHSSIFVHYVSHSWLPSLLFFNSLHCSVNFSFEVFFLVKYIFVHKYHFAIPYTEQQIYFIYTFMGAFQSTIFIFTLSLWQNAIHIKNSTTKIKEI